MSGPQLLYFVARDTAGDVRVVYRVSRIGNSAVAEYCNGGPWVADADIYRRYLNGFDADIDSVAEAEGLRLVAALRTGRERA